MLTSLQILFIMQIFNEAWELECFGFSEKGCLDCAFDTYKATIGIGNFFPPEICKKKDSTHLVRNAFITNKKCVSGSPCNGSLEFPYDNLIKAFIKEGNLANSVTSSELNFYILGSPHFITKSQLPNGREQLFRRLNATIKIKPFYCFEKSITGCFYENGENPVIFIKVDLFYFFVSRSMNVQNISFNGTDFHLHTSTTLNSPTANYNMESLVCNSGTINTLFISASKTPCALGSRTLKLGEIKDFTRFMGLFTLEGILDSPIMKTPELLLENCTFYLFYSTKSLDGWLALFVINGNYPTNMTILNCNFKSFRLAMGLIYIHTRENFLSSQVIYSSLFKNYPSLIDFKNTNVEAYNDFNIYGNVFWQANSREYDAYGIINVMKLDGNINFIQCAFKNIVHRVRRHSLFLINNVSSINIVNSDFKNLAYLSQIFGTESVQIVLDGIIFERMTFYINFISNYGTTNMTIRNSIMKNFVVTDQSSIVYETIYQSTGALLLERNIFYGTFNITFSLYSVQLKINQITLEGFESSYKTFFLLVECSIEINDFTLKNIKAKCPFVFEIKMYFLLDQVHKFSNTTFSNVTKVSKIYNQYLEDGYYEFFSAIEKTIYPLQAIIRCSKINAEDSLSIETMKINEVETDKLFYIGYFGSISINDLIFWADPSPLIFKSNLIEATFFKTMSLSSIVILKMHVLGNLIDLLCSDGNLEIKNITFDSIIIDGYSDLILYRGGNFSGQNILFLDINFTDATMKPGSFISLQRGDSIVIKNITTKLHPRSIVMSIIYVDTFQKILAENIFVEASDPNIAGDDSPRAAVILLSFVRTALIEGLLVKNLREFTNDSIKFQNGFLNFLGSVSSLIIYEQNDFYLNLSNIIMINCFQYNNGLIGIVNYNSVFLNNIYISSSKSHYGGTIYLNYVFSSEIKKLCVENILASTGGTFFLSNLIKVNVSDIFVYNSSSYNSAGVTYINTVDSISVSKAIFSQAFCQKNAAVFLVEKANTILTNITVIGATAILEGGMLYILRGTLVVDALFVYYLKSSKGGLIYAQECNKVILKNIIANSISVTAKGASLYLFKSTNIFALNLSLSNIYGSEAQGNILIDNSEYNYIVFSNILIKNVSLRIGNFFLLNSNTHISINSSEITGIRGNIFYLIGISKTILIMENSYFYDNQGLYKEDILIYTYNAIILFSAKNNNFIVSSLVKNYFLLENSLFYLEGGLFANLDSTIYSVFKIYNSTCVFNNSAHGNSRTSFLKQEKGIIYFTNLRFLDSEANENIPNLSFFEVDMVLIDKTTFEGQFTSFSGEIYFEKCDSIIKRTKFSRSFTLSSMMNNEQYEVIINFGLRNFFLFEKCIFENLGNKTSLIVSGASTIELVENLFYFSGNPELFIERVAVILFSSNASIISCTFKNFQGQSGSALSFKSKSIDAPSILLLKNSVFENNYAQFGGAVFIEGFAQCNFNQNIFKSNKAFKTSLVKSGIAGSIYFICDSDNFMNKSKLMLFSNNFTDNWAENFAPTVFSFALIELDDSRVNYFENNRDALNFSSELAGLPLRLDFSDVKLQSSSLEFFNGSKSEALFYIISGISFDFNISAKDNFGNILVFDSASSSKLDAFNLNIQGGSSKSIKGISSFKDTILFYKPGHSIKLNLSLILPKYLLFPGTTTSSPDLFINLEIKILSRPCLVGEIFNPDEPSCRQCPYGKYSLEDPMIDNVSAVAKCLTCPLNSVCYSGSYITPFPGYWRASNISTLIIECFNKEACLGYQENLTYTESNLKEFVWF